MKFFVALTALTASLTAANPVPDAKDGSVALGKRGGIQGLDVDFATGPGVPWPTLYTTYNFALIQTTYGMTVTNTVWPTQKSGARKYKFFTGGVHHPDPAVATAGDQAKFFSANGGDWVLDKRTIPGALYLEADKHNKTTPYCYNLTAAAWTSWIKEFVTVYNKINGRYPLIHTTYDWWKQCTYGSTSFAGIIDLWLINYTGIPTPLPIPWTAWVFWQYAPVSTDPWRLDQFDGNLAGLQAYVL